MSLILAWGGQVYADVATPTTTNPIPENGKGVINWASTRANVQNAISSPNESGNARTLNTSKVIDLFNRLSMEHLTIYKSLFSTEDAMKDDQPILDEKGNKIKVGLIPILTDKTESLNKDVKSINTVLKGLLSNEKVTDPTTGSKLPKGLIPTLTEKTQNLSEEVAKKANKEDLDKTNIALKALLAPEEIMLPNGQKLEKGIITTLADKTKDLQEDVAKKANQDDLDKKADKDYVDTNLSNIITHVNTANDVLDQELLKVKDQANVNKISVANLESRTELAEGAIAKKANQEDLDKKADKDYVDTNLSNIITHVNTTNDVLDQELLKVKDQANVNKISVANLESRTELAEGAIARKADKTYVDDEIQIVKDSIPTEQNLSDIRAGLEKKSDKEYVDRADERLQQNIINVDNKANANIAAISDLKVRAEATENAIRANFNRINNNAENINKLDQRVTKLDKKLERGLAQQAALSGLFQPYNVGKVNITAAVGGYKSATAVAVGAGYRFNDKVAAKAGVSFSGNATSYNVGVNYEF
ncbi:YadA C-terminal domain-containing protein [Ursidibacter arcticus]